MHMLRTMLQAVTLAGLVSTLAFGPAALAQVPVPFPRPGQPPAPKPGTTVPAAPLPSADPQTGDPSEATLGAPIYPSARFIASYDAGHGQRYYLFGAESDFLQIVGYYKTMLKQRGELIFDEPPIHMFELAKYREETMAFTPSVTVKDYTSGGSAGYLNPKRGATPARYKTIIQIVPAPPVVPK
jgi:hypothetical protein